MTQTIVRGRYVAGGPWADRLLTSQVQHLKASFRTGEKREERRIFGPLGEIADQAAARVLLMEARGKCVTFHRLILSPPRALIRRDDLETWTRLVLMDLSHSRGQRLVWAAAVHTNTDHAHAHVLVAGTAARTRWPQWGAATDVTLHRTDYTLLRTQGDARSREIALLAVS